MTPQELILRKLETTQRVSDLIRRAFLQLPVTISEDIQSNRELISQGEVPNAGIVVLEGLIVREKLTNEGKRQILSFHFPGEIPDLQGLILEKLNHGLRTLSSARIGLISLTDFQGFKGQHPDAADMLWRETMIDASISREWLLNVGARRAIARVGHLCLELCTRAQAIGLSEDRGFQNHITQTQLGEALGLSTVHINRSLRFLRDAEMIEFRNQHLHILDRAKLAKLADFDSHYLYLLAPSSLQ